MDNQGPPIRGLAGITGEPDTGKTTFALTTGVPSQRIAFIDDDLKTQSVADSLEAQGKPFGSYFNLTREFAQSGNTKPADLHDMVMDHLRKLKSDVNEYDVLVFDNWSRMEGGIRDHSLKNMTKLSSMTPGQIAKMTQFTWPFTYNYYQEILDFMLSIAPLVFIITHVKKRYKTDILEARGQRPLVEKSSFRIWLRHNPDSPAPIGLVLKRIMKLDAETMKPVSILPRRIKPCTWATIKNYIANPIGDRQPNQEEMPNAFELSILDGTLTDDQKNSIAIAKMEMEKEAREDEDLARQFSGNDDADSDEVRLRAIELYSEDPDLKPVQVMKMLKNEGFSVKVPTIVQWIKEL